MVFALLLFGSAAHTQDQWGKLVCREGSAPAFGQITNPDDLWNYSCEDPYVHSKTAASTASAVLPVSDLLLRDAAATHALGTHCAPLLPPARRPTGHRAGPLGARARLPSRTLSTFVSAVDPWSRECGRKSRWRGTKRCDAGADGRKSTRSHLQGIQEQNHQQRRARDQLVTKRQGCGSAHFARLMLIRRKVARAPRPPPPSPHTQHPYTTHPLSCSIATAQLHLCK